MNGLASALSPLIDVSRLVLAAADPCLRIGSAEHAVSILKRAIEMGEATTSVDYGHVRAGLNHTLSKVVSEACAEGGADYLEQRLTSTWTQVMLQAP